MTVTHVHSTSPVSSRQQAHQATESPVTQPVSAHLKQYRADNDDHLVKQFALECAVALGKALQQLSKEIYRHVQAFPGEARLRTLLQQPEIEARFGKIDPLALVKCDISKAHLKEEAMLMAVVLLLTSEPERVENNIIYIDNSNPAKKSDFKICAWENLYWVESDEEPIQPLEIWHLNECESALDLDEHLTLEELQEMQKEAIGNNGKNGVYDDEAEQQLAIKMADREALFALRKKAAEYVRSPAIQEKTIEISFREIVSKDEVSESEIRATAKRQEAESKAPSLTWQVSEKDSLARRGLLGLKQLSVIYDNYE
ncbi:hypothetical protein RGU70_16120 [Herbaspirillum sp. RTI4]|uniref:hypothetical protein n=1 Tax=Herbaspirillum sp. RTI4 TaxID=3048640 RepID=UPI002AB57EFF|nr:hypothetical protein [Herbaspirillum sp. RTI4]MDY7579842.1 hypothetical protein [Herbaspirillum sp. RTI4]MEA9981929.1 hypothetical protein [Herbaspirillum sp. RTI4]